MNPVDEVSHVIISQNPVPKNQNFSSGLVTILSVAAFILLALGAIVFLYNQNQTLKEKLAGYQVTPAPVLTTTPSPAPSADLPTVSSPSAGSKVKSPLKVTGTVPAGWMFEGTFPIKLVDLGQNIIAQTGARETVKGSWQTGGLVEFSATLTFKAATGSGTLILENDNPSGNPENSKTLEIPINF